MDKRCARYKRKFEEFRVTGAGASCTTPAVHPIKLIEGRSPEAVANDAKKELASTLCISGKNGAHSLSDSVLWPALPDFLAFLALLEDSA
jgi:hypothetical protein